MKLTYSDKLTEGKLNIINFACADIDQLKHLPELFKILWVQKGSFHIKVDGRSVHLSEQQVIFLTPHQVIEAFDSSEHVVVFTFNRAFYCVRDHDAEVSCSGYLFYGSADVTIAEVTEEDAKSLDMIYQMFVEEFGNKDQIQGEMLQMLLKRLIIIGTRIARRNLVNPDIKQGQLDIVRQFNVLVEQHFREKHQVSDYAEILFKSPKTLSNLFAQYNAKTPLQVINERLLLEARRLLRESDLTAKEIAHRLGYSSANHFSKFFKKNMGVSPSEFKKS